jgi:D-aminopeptidase
LVRVWIVPFTTTLFGSRNVPAITVSGDDIVMPGSTPD